MLRFAAAVTAAALLVPSIALAHHGWSSYDSSKEIDVSVQLRDVRWSNPHGSAKAVYNRQLWTVVLCPSRGWRRAGDPRHAPQAVRLIGYPRSDGTRECASSELSRRQDKRTALILACRRLPSGWPTARSPCGPASQLTYPVANVVHVLGVVLLSAESDRRPAVDRLFRAIHCNLCPRADTACRRRAGAVVLSGSVLFASDAEAVAETGPPLSWR